MLSYYVMFWFDSTKKLQYTEKLLSVAFVWIQFQFFFIWISEIASRAIDSNIFHFKYIQQQHEDDPATDEEEEGPPPIRELTEEEKRSIEASSEYSAFLNKASRFMERALTHKIDLFTEYNLQTDEERFAMYNKYQIQYQTFVP